MRQLVQQIVKTPLGSVSLVTLDDKLCALDFEDYESRMHKLLARYRGEYTLAQGRDGNGIAKRVRAYFDGDLHAIDDIEVDTGGTEFQQQCWQALRTIPAGKTASYAEQARRIGRPQAMRAVGLANGSNPVAVVVPCHRVIGANGTLTGYGGGLWRKEWLLKHEGALQADFPAMSRGEWAAHA
jgi:methylated-DNA-[protein]-cysteine S-methyltransferase